MAKITSKNFHLNTFADFKKIKTSEIPNRKPNFISSSGSKYWYTPNAVIRQSNHWGRTIATCNWLLNSSSYKGLSQGICAFSDFKHENLHLLKEGKKFKVVKTVLIRNGGGRLDISSNTGKFVKATSDYYIFDTFKVGWQTLAYIENIK